MLVGRDAEMKRLRDVLEATRAGRSGALILHGEPGVGKTSLLEEAVAEADDFLVLRSRPLESESGLPFSGLADLVRPVAELLPQIPGRQAEALAGAVALGPVVPGDRFAVAAATLSLLAAAARERPVLVVVDDAQWLDSPSREAIFFAARRLGAEGVAVLAGARDGVVSSGLGVPELRIDGLGTEAAVELVRHARSGVPVATARMIAVQTRGNPLALLETVSALDAHTPRESAPGAAPLTVSADIEAAFGAQVRVMPVRVQRALLLAAANDSGSIAELTRALVGQGLAMTDIEPAERRGLVSLAKGEVAFRHPLVRSAAYQLHPPSARREAHRSLAAAIDRADFDRVAWHLASAAVGPDERVAASLEEVGLRALDRRGPGAATRALTLAGELSVNEEDAFRRKRMAAEAALRAGDDEAALSVLDELLDHADDPACRAEVQLLRGKALIFRHPSDETRRMLVDEADRVALRHPEQAAALLADAAFCSMVVGEPGSARDEAERSLALDSGVGSPGNAVATAMHWVAVTAQGDIRAARQDQAGGLRLLEEIADRAAVDHSAALPRELAGCVLSLGMLEGWEAARAFFTRFVAIERSRSAAGSLPLLLQCWAQLELRAGDFTRARALASEAAELAAVVGQEVNQSPAFAVLANLDAIQGRDADCRDHVARSLQVSRRFGIGSGIPYALSALGLLELGRGRAAGAVEHLSVVASEAHRIGVSQLAVAWLGDFIEALIQSGRIDQAIGGLAELEQEAEGTGQRWAQAVAARCHGLLAAEDEFETHFAHALEMHRRDPSQFEVARTMLCLGRRRRRVRRRVAAREALQTALSIFEGLGAEPWAEQARAELRATGAVVAATDDRSFRDLTPQELQVALHVAQGATNAEVAAELFLSPRTVEFHLRNAYRKLGVRSRTEMANRLRNIPN